MRQRKEVVVPKVDFYQVIQRRGLDMKTWLEREQISSLKEIQTWMDENSNTYTFSEQFISDVNGLFPDVVSLPETWVPSEESSDLEESEEDESSIKKRKKTNKVQNDSEMQ